jgi:pimeloyl-ACP methyl ester carboxylesterase
MEWDSTASITTSTSQEMPSDTGKDHNEWHDVHDAAQDLHQILLQVHRTEMGISTKDRVWPIFVAHSMGTAVAQLYARSFPGEVASFLLLDATPTDTDGTSWYPDPDAAGFDATAQPAGVTAEILRDVRRKQDASPYSPNSINAEGIRWNNLQEYIPAVGAPKFIGPAMGTPLVTIIMHDAKAYAKQVTQVCKFALVVNCLLRTQLTLVDTWDTRNSYLDIQCAKLARLPRKTD